MEVGEMTENKSYEIQGKGFENVRDLCSDLRSKLNSEGFNLNSNIDSSYVDGSPITDDRAIGLVYLLDEEKKGIEVSIISDKSSVGEGESFLDYSFVKATVRPLGDVDVEKLKSGMVEILYEQIRRNYFMRKVEILFRN